MSVNSAHNIKPLLFLLIVALLSANALVIKQKHHKTPSPIQRHLAKPPIPQHKSKTQAPAHGAPKERRLMAKQHAETNKSLRIVPGIDKPIRRQLNDILGSFFPVMVVALVAYLMITAPYFGFLLFGLPMFLNMLSSVLGKDCGKKDGKGRLLHTGVSKKVIMKHVKTKLTQDSIIDEGRKLLKFLKAQNVTFGEPIDKRSFLKLLQKYTSKDERFKKEKNIGQQLKSMVDNIYSHEEQISNILSNAT